MLPKWGTEGAALLAHRRSGRRTLVDSWSVCVWGAGRMTKVSVQSLAGTHSVPGKSRFLRPQWPGICPQRTHKLVNTVVAVEPGCIFPRFLGGVSTLLVSCACTKDVREAKVSICFSFSLRPQSSLR